MKINENKCKKIYGKLFFGEKERIKMNVRILIKKKSEKLIN